MSLKYPNTIDRAKVAANIADLERQNWPRKFAIIAAMNAARASWFRQHPNGALPLWMALPKECRAKKDYQSDGAPTYFKAPLAQNPAPSLSVRQGAKLLESFTGAKAKTVRRVNAANITEAIDIGKVIGIIYETTRDGVKENYIHKFKVSARPHLVVSTDGRAFRSLGGDFRFTDRGFVDGK